MAYSYRPVTEAVALQTINAMTVFDEFIRTQRKARSFKGGMYWKRQGQYEYLVRTFLDNSQKRVGPRSPETEVTFAEFVAEKQRVTSRLASLRTALADAQRLNRAVRAGHVPNVIISILRELERRELLGHCVVGGTAAAFAYEAAAGVRLVSVETGRQVSTKVAGSHMRLFAGACRIDEIRQALTDVDSSFQAALHRQALMVNSRGLKVEFSPCLLGLTEAQTSEEVIPEHCSAQVIGLNGTVANIPAILPTMFVSMHSQSERELADAVQQMLGNGAFTCFAAR